MKDRAPPAADSGHGFLDRNKFPLGEPRLGRLPAGLARSINGMHLHQSLSECRVFVQENSPAPAQYVSIKTFTTSSLTFLPFNYLFRLYRFLFDQPGP